MKTLISYIIVTGVLLSASSAQEGRHKSGDPPPTGGDAELHITPNPRQIPDSLRELADNSVLIVYGTVKAVLPARETSPRALETDAMLNVSNILKGSPASRQVLFSQCGGTRGELTVTPVQYSLVRPGEEYLLFLVEDHRPNIPDVSGMKRYLVAGIWSGLFRFDNGKMRVTAKRPDPLRKKYEGLTVDQITSELKPLLQP